MLSHGRIRKEYHAARLSDDGGSETSEADLPRRGIITEGGSLIDSLS